MKKPFTLLNHVASDDTRECVRAVMRAVNAGECIGVAMAVMYRSRGYDLMVCGEAARSRTFTRGMVEDLSDKLALGPKEE